MSSNPRHKHIRTASVLMLTASLTALGTDAAFAQSPTQLPGIVVQGATLSPPPAARTAPAPKSAPAPAASQATQVPSVPSVATGPGAPLIASGGGDPAAAGPGSEIVTRDDKTGGYRSDTVGSSVTVVSGDEIRRQQIRHAGDALRSLPGVTVNRGGGFGAQTQVRIRGAEANHTLVLIDGIIANDTNNGAFDFSDLSADNIERIEVIRGPQSGLYGSNALGGVINIVTKGGRGPLEVTARTEAGSFGTFDYALRASGGNDKAWGSIAYHERHSQGFNVAPFGSEVDGATLKTLNIKGGVRIADGLVLDFVLRHSDKRGDRDTEGGPVGSLAVQVDDPTKFGTKIFLGGLNLRWDTLDGRVTHVVRVNRNETRIQDLSPTFLTQNVSETLRYGYLGTVRFDTPALFRMTHAMTVLVEKEFENFTPQSDFADSVTRDRSRLATALEYKGELGRFSFTGNIRRDDNDTFEDFTTWRTAASLRLTEIGLRPHASVGTGVKLPTMFENFGLIPGSFTPNPLLQPEESKGWDAGVELTLWSGRAIFDVTYFEQDLRNKINGFAPGPGFTFTAVNTPGISQRDGVEVSARVALTPVLLLSGAYTHLVAVDAAGLDEVRRPRHSGRADVTYLFDNGRGTATLSALYNGAMDDSAFRILGYFGPFPFTAAERVTLNDYWLINAAASYKVLPGVEVFGRVENLLNEKYQEIYGFGTPGIAGFGGVKLTFGGEGEPRAQPPTR
ncbi:MAG: TonB-dependent receptor plug domain-containing protein [Hyphomicrobiaceae bacterium]